MGRRSRDERGKISGRIAQGKSVSAVHTPEGTDLVHDVELRPAPTGDGLTLQVAVYREGEFYAEDHWLVDDTWNFATLDEALTFLQERFDLDYRELRLRAG